MDFIELKRACVRSQSTAWQLAAPGFVLPLHTRDVGVGKVILNAVLVVPVRVPEDAVSVYPVPALSMLKPEKLATPLEAATVTVPERVPLEGFVPIARVTLET